MHDHAHHHHDAQGGSTKLLLGALTVTLGFAGVEALAGWWANSLALFSDAGHMVTDSVALGLAAVAARVAQRPATEKHTFGLERTEAVAAAANALMMLAIVAGIVISAVERLTSPPDIRAGAVILVGGLGLAVNLGVAWILNQGERTLNVRGALLHVMGDLLGSVAALASGVIIWLTGWSPIDPVLSLLIGALILFSSLNLLREVLHVLMEGVPRGLQLPAVGRRMAEVEGVREVHDLHIWTISSSTTALSAHVVIDDLSVWHGVLTDLLKVLRDDFGIDHATLQPEPRILARVPVGDIGRGR